MTRKAKNVFVGLSGGVDSSVSAALLKEAGYEVIGVFIRVWQSFFAKATKDKPDFFTQCTVTDDRLDAMRVSAALGIPFRELNLEKKYKKEVVDEMIREYRAGRTPNPDVSCNRFIKFGGFYDWALQNGADFVATGHYSRVEKVKSQKSKGKSTSQNSKLDEYNLLAGKDTNKDQSYFLWQIRKEQLPHILFPVGNMTKPEVRKLAKRFGLPTAEKKDSQGLCFVGKVDMKEFLSHYLPQKRGKVLGEDGAVVGEHDGAVFYTIGERLLGRYVVEKDLQKNIVTISSKNAAGALPHAQSEVVLEQCNWLAEPKAGERYAARTRYRQPLQPCTLAIRNDRGLMLARHASVRFESPQTVAPGQSLVVYDVDVVLGGGVIL